MDHLHRYLHRRKSGKTIRFLVKRKDSRCIDNNLRFKVYDEGRNKVTEMQSYFVLFSVSSRWYAYNKSSDGTHNISSYFLERLLDYTNF